MKLSHFALAMFLSLTPPVLAEVVVDQPVAVVSIARLGEVMHFDALFEVLREEGMEHGKTMETDMFPSGGGAEWTAAVSNIYDVQRLRARFNVALRSQLASDPTAVDEIIAFFSSDLGQRILSLELEARRAFLDTAAEDAARVAADDRAATRDPKHGLNTRMIEAADLLEMNVAAALSGNLAFMRGMAETGAYGKAVPEDQIVSDVWAQEEQIRSDTSSWLYAYLGLAYDPLTEAELQAYIDFTESRAGRRLNAALFTAFDTVFSEVSHDLGRAAGIAVQGRDI